MSDGYLTAAQREALRLICDHGPLDTRRLGEHLIAARPASTNPGYAPAIARMAGTLAWRLQAQGFVTESGTGLWRTSRDGRALIGCPAV
ncbi:hypothetical protein E1292_25165 [Nonomuraea deserti]|uniref:Restriction system protein Mrr-like N-terminal domain-containing protein n=1 Tax=Nonomuraea deserti TaxID=1848322 RepID=A0A4R4VAG5_9ACTN|nr:hypothetical protein [Nonomuraea deserti]TDD01721.1 hypothetical protein E1292_25165 [Nonomuraea deserti]